jgi:hypothetical protein
MDVDGRGLSVGEIAPKISTKDINGNEINSEELLRENRGLLIDFFRGAW